jgi:peptide/nickel transport system substrate-binding protein
MIQVRNRLTAAIVVVATALALTACGSNNKSGGATTAGSSGAGPTTHANGLTLVTTAGKAVGDVDHLNWGMPYGEPNTIDPPNTAFYSSAFAAAQMCDALLRYNPDLSTKPGLATVTQPDPKTIQIALRKGVKFWDGTEMTSADVQYSLQRTADPKNIVGFLFTAVKSIDATSRYHVTIHLKTPDELPIKELASFSGMVYEKKFAEKAGKSFGSSKGGIMCSGPYELAKWNPGTSIELKANPHYWDPAYKPHAATVSLKFFNNSSTLASALAAGEIDGAYEVPAQTIPQLSKASSGKLHYGPSMMSSGLSVARPDGPLKSVKLRQALYMTLDRSAIAKVVFHGAATPAYTLLAPSTWDPAARGAWAQAYKPFETAGQKFGTAGAVEQAKQLVSQSGYDGTPLVFTIQAGDVVGEQISQLVQEQAKQIGVKVKINALPAIKYAQASTDPKARAGTDLLQAVNFNIAQDPLEPIPFTVLPGSFYNYTNYSDSQVTKLLTEAKQTLDPAKRNAMTIQAQSIYEKDYLAETLVEIPEISFLNNRLAGATTSFAYMDTPSLALIGSSGKS